MPTAQPTVTDCPLDRIRPPDPSTRASGPVIAIDLGTSTCRVGAVHKGAVVCIPAERQEGAPSLVALGSGGRIVVGNAARQQQATSPALAVWGVKGLIAAPYGDPRMRWLYEQLRCPVTASAEGEPAVQLGDRTFAAHELAALLFHEARERAQNFLGQPVHRAVFTVPPSRNEGLSRAMAAAAARAGLHVERLISEPTAVALAAFQRHAGKPERTGMVCDWGGGRFQVALLRYAARQCQVLASASDIALCGAELDKRLLQWAASVLPQGLRVAGGSGDFSAVYRLLGAVEHAKVQLSEQQQVRIRVPVALMDGAGRPGDFDATLTRAELEELARPLVDSALRLCERVLEEALLLPAELDEVLLVGGQSAMPLFQQRARQLFVGVPVHLDEPGKAVVLGAARLSSASPTSASPTPPGGTAPVRRS